MPHIHNKTNTAMQHQIDVKTEELTPVHINTSPNKVPADTRVGQAIQAVYKAQTIRE